MCSKYTFLAVLLLMLQANTVVAGDEQMLQANTVVAGDEQEWASKRGTFKISLEAELDPIPINKIHWWVLTVRTVSGDPVTTAEISVLGGMPLHDDPVTTAEISVLGGMPLHDHGMPTRPRVSENLGEGRYRLEGMRFHMNGEWEVSVTVKADGKVDTVIIALNL